MTAIEHIKAAQQAKLVDEDGEAVALELAGPLTSERIDSLQKRLGQPLPEELRTLLAFCSGIEGCLGGMGTNWVFVGNVPLGFTNSTERSISIDVNFPERPRPWKARLTYMPAFGRAKLLRWRLAEAWKTKSLNQGFGLTGWEGAQHAYSPEIAE